MTLHPSTLSDAAPKWTRGALLAEWHAFPPHRHVRSEIDTEAATVAVISITVQLFSLLALRTQ